MRRAMKIWLIVAASLVVLGCAVAGVAIALLHMDVIDLPTSQRERNFYEITEEVRELRIQVDTADLEIVPSDSDKSSVECYELKKQKHSVTVEDGVLTIQVEDTRKWYEHIGIWFGSSKVTVSLPAGAYGSLTIDSDTGDVKIAKDFQFKSVDVSATTGDITNYASAEGAVNLKASTGHLCVEEILADSLSLSVSTGEVRVSDVTVSGDVTLNVTTGKASLDDLTCQNISSRGNTGDLSLEDVTVKETLSVERSTGDVNLDDTIAARITVKTDTGDVSFEDSDASELYVTTDTGSVEGNLLTEKVFLTKTDTGKVRVPNSITGGRCEITTDTGDIEITVP